MALLTAYGSGNCQVLEDKTVTYSSKRISGWWTFQTPLGTLNSYDTAWEITRNCRLRWQFVGMTKGVAQHCRDACVNLFSRPYYTSVYRPNALNPTHFDDLPSGSAEMANVSLQWVGGNMWQVTVDLNEVDTVMRIYDNDTTPYSLSTYFNGNHGPDIEGRSYAIPSGS